MVRDCRVLATAILLSLVGAGSLVGQTQTTWVAGYAGESFEDDGLKATVVGGQLGVQLLGRLGVFGDLLIASTGTLLGSAGATLNRMGRPDHPGPYIGLAADWMQRQGRQEFGPGALLGVQMPITAKVAAQLEARIMLNTQRVLLLAGLSMRI